METTTLYFGVCSEFFAWVLEMSRNSFEVHRLDLFPFNALKGSLYDLPTPVKISYL